jgi:carboxypeptidase Taq
MNCFADLFALRRRAACLASVGSLLGWDQETYMPGAGSGARAEQASLLAELAHEASTSTRLGDLLAQCEASLPALDAPAEPKARLAASIREARREYDLATKLPSDLVAQLAKVGSEAQQVWKAARETNDFPAFAPVLETMFDLTRQKANCLGVPKGGELYDALIDEYEPGVSAAQIAAVFNPLRDRLAGLIARVASSGKTISDAPLHVSIPPDLQHKLGLFVLEAMGFDLSAGRLDTTSHPFCSGLAPGDTRLTTRYRDQHFTDALYSTMHEGGHGLYEQGLPKTASLSINGQTLPLWGSPLADAISLGIHESQSRMWENLVGRSREFWTWLFPHAQRIFAGALDKYTPDDLFRAVNTTTPSLIRVEADEGTYNLHVMLRFELERALLNGEIKPKDLPAAWNARIKSYLGLAVPDDRRGCLQDVHWSFGLIGYFPTYTLGNLYAAQLWETIHTQLPSLNTNIASGNLIPLRNWLNTNIHAHGKQYSASDLCQRVTGKPLSADPLMRHLERNAKTIYNV